uniref:Major facilitator superfamily (MFS) profile domain-containing protein n=1 Tax=Quercus lobata TaxID=97700 RepID=A0A7N2L4A9_QUELO
MQSPMASRLPQVCRSAQDDLSGTFKHYSVFGSIMTTGAMLGAILSGRIADILGRRGFMISFGSAVTYFDGTVVSWRTLALIAVNFCRNYSMSCTTYRFILYS